MKESLKISSNKVTCFTLFSSTGTLICCALPIIFVTIGLGSSIAALTNAFPFLIFLSIHKTWVFLFSGIMMFISAWFIYGSKQSCPADQQLGNLCNQTKIWNKRIFSLSLSIWVIGFFASYLLLPLRIFLDI
ncbi:MAG: hypothetical protein COA66_10145 [Arcobacter sp.]|nr:MAG: hypothetical protein COA66_10145 [Arcobacter sp.]